jgi:predicted acylesterase/phospholipase RssA
LERLKILNDCHLTLGYGPADLTLLGAGRVILSLKKGLTMNAHPRSAQLKTAIDGNKTVSLALQGGGTHGAFTWGVLDRLLEEDRLIIDGATATSAGSINAALVAYGLSVGGREAAKEALARFWRRISAMAALSVVQPSVLDKMSGTFGLDYSPGYLLINTLCQFLSPYQSVQRRSAERPA